MIPDEPPWQKPSESGSHGAYQSGGYQAVPSSSSPRAGLPNRPSPDIHAKPKKRIKPYEDARSQSDLPEGCVDIFVAESESSDEDGEDATGIKNVWKKMKGRLKNDINDFSTKGP